MLSTVTMSVEAAKAPFGCLSYTIKRRIGELPAVVAAKLASKRYSIEVITVLLPILCVAKVPSSIAFRRTRFAVVCAAVITVVEVASMFFFSTLSKSLPLGVLVKRGRLLGWKAPVEDLRLFIGFSFFFHVSWVGLSIAHPLTGG